MANEKTKKTVLITGGSRGLGKNAALAVAEQGMDVVITYRAARDEADATVAELRAKGVRAAALMLDVGDVKSFPAFFTELARVLKAEFGADKFDALVNNGGQAGYSQFESVTEEMFDGLMNTHFKGVYFLTQRALPYLNDGGRIITVSSGLARVSMVGSSAYGSMKGAIEVFTRYLAKELGPRGIAANCVAPGAIATDFGGGRLRGSEDMQKMVSGITALGRYGVPDDIGPVIAFLCTDAARWINGQRIEVSGGMAL
jgi:NAD(P)-dependent dehydrogenase (short-subunit alcohol dehydrogenase family)